MILFIRSSFYFPPNSFSSLLFMFILDFVGKFSSCRRLCFSLWFQVDVFFLSLPRFYPFVVNYKLTSSIELIIGKVFRFLCAVHWILDLKVKRKKWVKKQVTASHFTPTFIRSQRHTHHGSYWKTNTISLHTFQYFNSDANFHLFPHSPF